MGSIFGILVGGFLILNGIWIKRNPKDKILMKGFFLSKRVWPYYIGGGIIIITFSLFVFILGV